MLTELEYGGMKISWNGAPSPYDAARLVVALDAEVRAATGTSVVDQQNYNNILVEKPLIALEPSFKLATARNGPDYSFVNASGVSVDGEMKSIRSRGGRSKVAWQFHALAVLANPPEQAFLFYAHHNGFPCRIYDMRHSTHVTAVNEHLAELAGEWRRKVESGEITGKHDVVAVKEQVVQDILADVPFLEYRDEAIRDCDYSDMFSGGTSATLIQSDIYSLVMDRSIAPRCDG